MEIIYDTIIIYYFPGTGNALKVAEWFEEKANEYGIEVYKHSIDRFEKITPPELNGRTHRLVSKFNPELSGLCKILITC